MRIDLHTHTSASDGTDTPAELVQLAVGAGLDVIAITDHDTTEGWAAAAVARPAELSLVRGAEFSTQVAQPDRVVSVHLLGYLFDPLDPVILAEQRRVVAERLQRGLAMVDLMVADGLSISREQVLDIAAGAPVGRPHLGRALVDSGVVGSVDEAFDGYLGGPGSYYRHKVDTDLPAAVGMIVAAGGAPVIAHPRGRGEHRALTPELIGELADLGLAGLEVDHVEHDAAARAEVAGIAKRFDLVPLGSSDYHGHNKTVRLGACLTAPESLSRLLDRTSGAVPVLSG